MNFLKGTSSGSLSNLKLENVIPIRGDLVNHKKPSVLCGDSIAAVVQAFLLYLIYNIMY